MASCRPMGSSWAAVERQMAGQTVLEALLGGSWGGLGGSWAALGTSLGRLGPPELPGSLRGALGRQFGARWPGRPLRKRSWTALGAVLAALGPLLAPLWAVLALPRGPREAPGGSGEGLREALWELSWMVQRQKLKKQPKTSYFNFF